MIYQTTHDFVLKEVWLVMTNTDLNEGRGSDYVLHVCEIKATATRLSKKSYVQGTDSPIIQGTAHKINHEWFSTNNIIKPNDADIYHQKRMDDAKEKLERKLAALAKAKRLGLTDEEIKAITEFKG